MPAPDNGLKAFWPWFLLLSIWDLCEQCEVVITERWMNQ